MAYANGMKRTWGLVLVGLALTACSNGGNGSTNPPGGGTPAGATITGTVVGFNGAANTPIVLQLYLNDQAPTTVANGSVAQNGSFSVTLPDQTALSNYLFPIGSVTYPGCQGTLNSSDAAAKFVDVRYLSVQPAGAPAYNVYAASNDGSSIREWVYADRAATISGSLSCNLSIGGVTVSGPVSVNLALKQGWNSVVENVASSGATLTVSDSGPTTWVAEPK